MEGNPEQFEAIGNRLGFRVVDDGSEPLKLVWQGARFPAFLCLGIALALLFISFPIVQAIRMRGFEGPAASLWYFPLMNLVLLGIAFFLLSLKRVLLFDRRSRSATFTKRSLLRTIRLSFGYDEAKKIILGIDRVYSGFAVAGSSAAEKFPIPSLRIELINGDSILVDRGGEKRLQPLAKRLSEELEKPWKTDPALAA